MSSSGMKKMIRLRCSDNTVFEVEEPVVRRSEHIKHMIEDDCHNDIIPLPPFIHSDVMSKVLEYCNKHYEAAQGSSSNIDSINLATQNVDDRKELNAWDNKLVDIDFKPLAELLNAANFLDIKDLFDLITQAFADKIKDKTPEEVRIIFNIQNDFTPEEEKAIRDQHPWAHEIEKKN